MARAVAAGTSGRCLVRSVVIFRWVVVAGKEADFAKDADVAARTAGALGGHLGVAVGFVFGVLAFAAPEEEYG